MQATPGLAQQFSHCTRARKALTAPPEGTEAGATDSTALKFNEPPYMGPVRTVGVGGGSREADPLSRFLNCRPSPVLGSGTSRWSVKPADQILHGLFATLSNAERRLYETVGLRRRQREIIPDPLTYADRYANASEDETKE